MGFVRLTLCALAVWGSSAVLAASAPPPPPPPFKNNFPESNQWSFTCVCGEFACSEQDPIVDYCAVYYAKTAARNRMVLFALKTMIAGREPKFVVGFGVDGIKGITRAQILSGGAAVNFPACAEPFCYTATTAEHVSALGGSPKIDARVYIGGSSIGTSFDGTHASELLQKLITLPQHN